MMECAVVWLGNLVVEWGCTQRFVRKWGGSWVLVKVGVLAVWCLVMEKLVVVWWGAQVVLCLVVGGSTVAYADVDGAHMMHADE